MDEHVFEICLTGSQLHLWWLNITQTEPYHGKPPESQRNKALKHGAAESDVHRELRTNWSHDCGVARGALDSISGSWYVWNHTNMIISSNIKNVLILFSMGIARGGGGHKTWFYDRPPTPPPTFLVDITKPNTCKKKKKSYPIVGVPFCSTSESIHT